MNLVAIAASLHDALDRAQPEREALALLLDRFSALVAGQEKALEEKLATLLYRSIERIKRDGPADLAPQLAEEIRALLALR